MKTINKLTKSYRLFERTFLQPGTIYPFVIPGLDKGQAVNLCQRLNRLHVHWAQENGVGLKNLSAKAKEGQDGTWNLEVSWSETNATGQRGRKSPEWMDELLERVEAQLASPQAQIQAQNQTSGTGWTREELEMIAEDTGQPLGELLKLYGVEEEK